MSVTDRWPELALADWRSTRDTLHLWTQVVGKIRFALTPWLNHSWHVTLYVTTRGLGTSAIPCDMRTFSVEFDFVHHRLEIACSDGASAGFALPVKSAIDWPSTRVTCAP